MGEYNRSTLEARKKVNKIKELKDMEGKPIIHTEEDNKQFETAMGGTKINGFDLAMQIYPLLDDYFCGTFAKNTKGVLMRMENGQVFQLTVTEVV